MKRSVLVIGGSSFAGRVFSIQASKNDEFDLHVVNRGNYPLEIENVNEYKCDRHSPRMIARLIPDIKYEALVDFCAYAPGEIKSVIDALGTRIKQYIYFSTAQAYIPRLDRRLIEGDPLCDISSSGDNIENSVIGKIKLERELIDACEQAGIKYTILRPVYIYGPFNYMPRESFFIELIARKHTVPVPVDSTSRFNFIYVFDIARALMTCIGDPRSFDEVFNLTGKESVSYSQLISDFERYNSGPFDTKEITLAEINEKNIPLPFPLTDAILYSGEKFAETFEFEYTPFSEGMEKTFKIFYSLFVT